MVAISSEHLCCWGEHRTLLVFTLQMDRNNHIGIIAGLDPSKAVPSDSGRKVPISPVLLTSLENSYMFGSRICTLRSY